MPHGFEVRDVRVFLTLAHELHFTRTAERVGLTPSRVSQTIRALEGRVGAPLFDRTSRRVALTPAGEALLRDLEPAYEQMQRAFSRAREVAIGVAGVLRLGMYTPINGGPHLTTIIKAFERRHPACRVQLTDTGFARDQLDWLREGLVDVLAIRLPLADPDIEIGPVLTREERVLVVAKDHPLAAQESVSYEDVAAYAVPLIPTLPPEAVDDLIPPRTPSGKPIRRIEVRTGAEVILRIAGGEVIHPSVQSFADHSRHPDITTIPLRDLPPSETALAWLRHAANGNTVAFARTAADVLRSRDVG